MATAVNLPVVSSSLLSVVSAFQPLFSPVPVHDNLYFDDGPRVSNAKPAVASSLSGAINTSAVDPYVQGVEMTRQAQYDAGLAKIWSGDAGHVLKPSVYGQDKNFFPDPGFADMDLFSARRFLEAQEHDSPLWWNIITFPIITGDNDQLENYNFNGIIEPFAIRPVVAFFSTDAPFEAHTIRANLAGGNENQLNGSDRVLTVDYFEPQKQIVGYLDMVDIIENHPLNGFFVYEFTSILPFSDVRLNRNAILDDPAEDAQLVEAMANMSGSTDNYVKYDQRSATCGWCYDNNTAIGTDAVAFGGMTH